MQNSINHFSHPKHPLKLYKGDKKPWNSSRCIICGQTHTRYLRGRQIGKQLSFFPIYGCMECRFKIDFGCAELPREITHPFHPQHSLSLYPIGSQGMNRSPCNACGSYDDIGKYTCRHAECKFNLDFRCVKLQPLNDGQLKHEKISHQHHVFACNQPTVLQSCCSFCQSRFCKTDLIYVCVDCKQLLHESCVFPQKTMHPFHPEHPLLLVPPPFYPTELERCNACSEPTSSFFTCSQCGFFLDLSCISLKPTCKSSDYDQELQNQPSKHPHPLIQCDPIKARRPCSGCDSPITNSIYVCLECRILLDKSCTQLLPHITNPFHPEHPLTLVKHKERSGCRICHNHTSLLKYECRKCNFLIDTRCFTSTKPYANAMVNSRFHPHPLAFMIEKPGYDWNIICKTCKKLCEKYLFICPECEYSIHLECCISLPLVIKHDSHCDPLVFTKSQIKDASDEDSDGEFYCHACEDLRDLNDPTYYCKECHFVAHLQCVLPAILKGLEAETTASPTLISIPID